MHKGTHAPCVSLSGMTAKRWTWTILGVLTLVAGVVLRANPAVAESVYGHGIYPVIRWVMSTCFGILPIPFISILAVLGTMLLYKTAIVPLRQRRWTWKSLTAGVVSTLCALVFLFQFLWGFNYYRPAWDSRLNIAVQGMTRDQLKDEFERVTALLLLRTAEIDDLIPLEQMGQFDFESALRLPLHNVLSEHGYSLVKSPRVRIVRPKGILMRWNTAGIYVPYSGEGHIDAGMLPVQIPFTLAHEMAHGFGVADEGDCNFLAYLACIASDHPHIRFAGTLSYWRYVASAYRMAFPEEYIVLFPQLPEIVRTTLFAIRDNDEKYPDLFPKVRNTVYDTYLKSQGVQDGLQSYNRVVQLVWAYQMRDEKERTTTPDKVTE